MQANETVRKPRSGEKEASRPGDAKAGGRAVHRSQFIPAQDSRNRRVAGLYVRNGRYYAQLWVDIGHGKKAARRMPLFDLENNPARTLQVAREALEVRRQERRENRLPKGGRKPSLKDYCAIYFEKASVQRKRPGTLKNERQALGRWCDLIGHVRIHQISTQLINQFTERRLKGGFFCGRRLDPSSERTANLDVLMLRNVLNSALDEELIRELPKIKKLAEPPTPRRPLLTPDDFTGLIGAAQAACTKNGQQVVDYLQFLAFSGSREKEALRIRLADVDFERERVSIGADGMSKNSEARTVEFNPKLAALLKDMFARRPPDSSWLFPSPQRGNRDDHAKSFRESLKLARKLAGVEWLGFHDLRHYFCSMCVMAGIDFMTIAAWMGHKDGGILVGKVYGHLLDTHRRRAAKSLHFAGVSDQV